MNTKMVMSASAIALGVAGIGLTFLPDELMGYLNWGDDHALLFFIQVLGALYFAFAMLNWMNRFSLIGGIYNRPVAIANFTHFFIAGLALLKGLLATPDLHYSIWVAGILYAVFALLFGMILFRHPLKEGESAKS